MEYLKFIIVIFAITPAVPSVYYEAVQHFRSLFFRLPNKKITSVASRSYGNATVESCAKHCVEETDFVCKSFEFEGEADRCHLHTLSHAGPRATLVSSSRFDHYRTNYEKLFLRLPDHQIVTHHNRKIASVTVEECSRHCIFEMTFKCRGFDYQPREKDCWLSEMDAQSANGIHQFRGVDYYERKPGGPLSHFINYGFGSLRVTANRIFMKVTLETCAKKCLEETTFVCASFDYIFSTTLFSSRAAQQCFLSEHIAANLYGLTIDHPGTIGHYELIGDDLRYFYAVPYSVLLGNNRKTYRKVTPNRCARMCLKEQEFICRSFDYQVQDAICLLSTKAGSDVGGLLSQKSPDSLGLAQIHHFEMKPLLDCGGALSGSEVNFASPGWPRNYVSNEYCEWQITVPQHKVVHMRLARLKLATQSSNSCGPENDRLLISEDLRNGKVEAFCVRPETRNIITKTNNVTVVFVSKVGDASGFRIFVTAEWPCNAILQANNGEFASPRWPNSYSTSTQCRWHIVAPAGHRVLLQFTSFVLEAHQFYGCDYRYDHVSVYNGKQERANSLVGQYCGTLAAPFTVLSEGTTLLVVFNSDSKVVRPGFHARYSFIKNGTQTASPPIIINQHSVSNLWGGTTPAIRGGVIYGTKQIMAIDRGHRVLQDELTTSRVAPTAYRTRLDGHRNSESDTGRSKTGESDNETNVKDKYSLVIWGAVVTVICLLIILGVSFFIICRYRRKQRKLKRIRSNYGYIVDTASLCEKESLYEKIPGDRSSQGSSGSTSPPPLPPDDGPPGGPRSPALTAVFNNPNYGKVKFSENGNVIS